MSEQPITFRPPKDLRAWLDEGHKKAGIDRTAFIIEALEWAREQDQLPTHVPKAIEEATPRRRGNGRMSMPKGRVYDRLP